MDQSFRTRAQPPVTTPGWMSLSCLALTIATNAASQVPADPFRQPRLVEEIAQRALRRDRGKLWGVRLDTVPLFLVAGSQVATSVNPAMSGFTLLDASWYRGALPSGVVVANTALTWAQRRWAMIDLPLPVDTLAAARLLIHERWHVVQRQALPLPKYNQFDPGAALLDRPDGRTWLRLEWLALAAALEASPRSNAERAAVRDALIFRARRYTLATDSERIRERLLDLDEGIPEYTAWRLTRSSNQELVRSLRELAPAAAGFARSFQYYTGPAYGYLLDRRAPQWRTQLRTVLDLQSLLAATLGRDGVALARWLTGAGDQVMLAGNAERRGIRYGLTRIQGEESARWEAMERTLVDLRRRFLDGPTVRLRPGAAMNIGFDPNRATSVGDAGTVYGNLVWKGANGAELSAPSGGLVNGSFSEIRVPLDSARFEAGALTRAMRWSGGGWSLSLPAGWRVERDGASWLLKPPE